jgi:uncharacterized membrane protein
MGAIYNRIAGQSVERLSALSDGIFAVVMTLLVLDIRVPPPLGPTSTDLDLLNALAGTSWDLLAYFMSFLTLGIFWVGQQTQLNQFARSDRNLTWIHLGFLLAVALMPVSTRLLSAFLTYRTALIVYWLNILLLGIMLFASWRYASRAGLLKDYTTAEIRVATERRFIVAQSLYAFGALLCIVNTYLSIAFIVLVQLNYVLAPRIRPLNRL